MMQKLVHKVVKPLKTHRRLLALALIAVLTVGTSIPAFAAEKTPTVSDDIFVGLAITGVFAGAIVSTVRGWWNADEKEKYSIRKLAGSIFLVAIQVPMQISITSLLASVPEGNVIAVAFTVFGQAMALGFSVDTLHSATKN